MTLYINLRMLRRYSGISSHFPPKMPEWKKKYFARHQKFQIIIHIAMNIRVIYEDLITGTMKDSAKYILG